MYNLRLVTCRLTNIISTLQILMDLWKTEKYTETGKVHRNIAQLYVKA